MCSDLLSIGILSIKSNLNTFALCFNGFDWSISVLGALVANRNDRRVARVFVKVSVEIFQCTIAGSCVSNTMQEEKKVYRGYTLSRDKENKPLGQRPNLRWRRLVFFVSWSVFRNGNSILLTDVEAVADTLDRNWCKLGADETK